MAKHRIVVRYTDGKMAKGYTANFSPEAPYFLLTPAGVGAPPEPVTIDMKMLKAVFFVRNFAGNPDRADQAAHAADRPYQGTGVRVEFADGEIMLGGTPSYTPEKQGFFVFPADTDANTLKVFAVNTAIKSVQLTRHERFVAPARSRQAKPIHTGVRSPAPARSPRREPREPYF